MWSYTVRRYGDVCRMFSSDRLIAWLITSISRRHLAEVKSRNSISELTYMNRVASAGLLSASLHMRSASR